MGRGEGIPGWCVWLLRACTHRQSGPGPKETADALLGGLLRHTPAVPALGLSCSLWCDGVCLSTLVPAPGFCLVKGSPSLPRRSSGGQPRGFCLCEAPRDNFDCKKVLNGSEKGEGGRQVEDYAGSASWDHH